MKGVAKYITQQTLGGIENGGNLTERNFNLICEKFNVNSEWLKNGTGEMFNPPKEKDFIEQLAQEKNLSPREKALIESIIELPCEVRENVIDWALNLTKKSLTKNLKIIILRHWKKKNANC